MNYFQHNAKQQGSACYVAPKLSAMPRMNDKLTKQIRAGIDAHRLGIAVNESPRYSAKG